MNDERLIEAITNLADATRAIAHGGEAGPTGLEGLALAVAGTDLRLSLSAAIAEGLNQIAEAISTGFEEIATAITDAAKPKTLPDHH